MPCTKINGKTIETQNRKRAKRETCCEIAKCKKNSPTLGTKYREEKKIALLIASSSSRYASCGGFDLSILRTPLYGPLKLKVVSLPNGVVIYHQMLLT